MKWLAIANPAAGRAREAERLLARLHDLESVDADIVHTDAPGHATRLAQQSCGYDGVIAIGGDGTIAEVLRGLRLDRQCLAVLPAGHGNCLARDLGVVRPAQALAAIRRGEYKPLDLMSVEVGFEDGRTDRRLCASTLAVGYVNDVVEFGRQRLPFLGHASYATAAMLVIPQKFEALVAGAEDPRRPQPYTGLVINNTMHLANFRVFTQASVRDGMLDVMELGHCWLRQMLHNLSVLAGSNAIGPLRMRRELSERVELLNAHTLMADGELLQGVIRIDVACRPAAVMCVAGAA